MNKVYIISPYGISQNNVNAHNLFPALVKLFDEQTVDKYELQDHLENVYRCTFYI